jgi:hypothetical protein
LVLVDIPVPGQMLSQKLHKGTQLRQLSSFFTSPRNQPQGSQSCGVASKRCGRWRASRCGSHGVHRLKGDSELLHIPDTNSALCLRDARARNHHYRLRGDLGDGARPASLRTTTYRTIADSERTLTCCGSFGP